MSFKNIRGQDKAINILKNYIAQSRLLGSYILTGPEGVGKQLVALNLAKTLNCQDNGAEPCDACASCQKIDKNQHPDVHVIACADSQIQIECIRQLQSRSSLKPYEGRVKVFIINDAHRLTAEASNALLKILEEPPKNTLIILITDKLNLLFKTIISRCKILRFSPLIRTELQEIISRDYGVDKASAHFLAYFSEGRLGCALRLKDTDILREKNRVIDAFGQSLTKTYENLNIQGKPEIRQNLNILASWFRDIYLVKIGLPHQELINFDRRQDLLNIMSRFAFADLNDIMDTISVSLKYLDQNINTRLLLNNLGVRLWED